MSTPLDRRSFLKTATAAGLGVGVGRSLGAPAPASARSANDTVVVAVMGVNSRGAAVARSFARVPNAEIAYICDVDTRAVEKAVASVGEVAGKQPKGETDFRRILDMQDIDVMVIATPDFWHTPAAILAMQAGKHVYVEKPGSHNPAEGKMLAEAQRRYNRVVQLGTQQRSDPRTQEAIALIREGLIGDVYYAKAWYANTRGPIGYGKRAPVPDWLDYELWQGPVPRQPFRDNLVHYNWHWFTHYGTGEACNNGTHEVDVCRWALGVDYPSRVVSSGGRFHYHDDWEFFDTQVMSFEFEGGKSITWEGRSCNGLPFYDRGRGSSIHGTEGTLLIDRDGYIFYDLDNNEIRRSMAGERGDGLNTVGGGGMTDTHAANFVDAIRESSPLNQPVAEGQKSVLLCHLGNIAQFTGRALHCNTADGKIVGDMEAMKLWGRDYEPGWEPTL